MRKAFLIFFLAKVSISICVLFWLHCTPSNPGPENGAVTAPAQALDLSGYHVIVLVIDSLRADHLGAYGYSRNTSPFIDCLAREGMVFENAISSSSYTRESVAALFTGRNPSLTPWGAGWYAQPDPEGSNMAERFREAGYSTGFFCDTPMLDTAAFRRGFDQYDCLAKGYDVSGTGPQLMERALRFLREHQKDRNFLYLHCLDPHAPYEPPQAYYLRFADQVYPHPLRLNDEVRYHLPELVSAGFGPGEARFEDLVLRYDGEIVLVDECVKRLSAGLRELGMQDKTLLVITADHGEEFLDHGFVEHAWRLYWESIHVPLIFWAPKALAPQRIAAPVSLVNLYPTVSALVGLPGQKEALSGAPLFRREADRWVFQLTERPILSELMVPMRTMGRSLIEGDYHYLQWQQWASWEECSQIASQQRVLRDAYLSGQRTPVDSCGPAVYEELFNIREDPREQRNLLPVEGARAAVLRQELADYCRNLPRQVADQVKADPRTAGATPEQQARNEQIESIGYIGGGQKPAAAPAAESVAGAAK